MKAATIFWGDPMRVMPAVLSALMLLSRTAGAQSLLDRSPNVSGDWVGAPGTVYFHFVHRFSVSPAPARKVSNIPTFLLAAGLPHRLLAGFNYSTNSTLVPNFPNEWELFARWAPLAEDYGAPLDVGAQVGYNNASNGVDGEVSVAKRIGPLRVIVAGRALSNPLKSGDPRFAAATGATLRLGQYLALAGDVASLTNRDSTERVAWSAGLHIAIPLTPHTLSLNATNAPVATLQGASRGSSTIRYGFEFTIPLTLSRYFGKRAHESPDTAVSVIAAPVDTAVEQLKAAETVVPAAPAPATPTPPVVGGVARDTAAAGVKPDTVSTKPVPRNRPAANPAPAKPATVKAVAPKPAMRMRRTTIKNTSFLESRIEVAVGTTVEWTNRDPLLHSVTAVDRSFNSGLIQPGHTFRHTFTRAGTFNFFCMPHPFMKGVVVVSER